MVSTGTLVSGHRFLKNLGERPCAACANGISAPQLCEFIGAQLERLDRGVILKGDHVFESSPINVLMSFSVDIGRKREAPWPAHRAPYPDSPAAFAAACRALPAA